MVRSGNGKGGEGGGGLTSSSSHRWRGEDRRSGSFFFGTSVEHKEGQGCVVSSGEDFVAVFGSRCQGGRSESTYIAGSGHLSALFAVVIWIRIGGAFGCAWRRSSVMVRGGGSDDGLVGHGSVGARCRFVMQARWRACVWQMQANKKRTLGCAEKGIKMMGKLLGRGCASNGPCDNLVWIGRSVC